MEWILFKTLLSLAAVLALMIGVVYLLRKYVYQPGSGSSTVVPVEVLGQKALHPKRSVVVLKVMHKILVVGMSEEGMQTLTTIDDEESLAEIARKSDEPLPASRWMTWQTGRPQGSFAAQLQQSLRTFKQRRRA